MPFFYDSNSNIQSDLISHDIFFYGSQKNPRRKKILEQLQKRYKNRILILNGIPGISRDNLILKSKIILNIHNFDYCALETCRINEILRFDKLVISERTCQEDWYNIHLYSIV
jgi:hypothetical protein